MGCDLDVFGEVTRRGDEVERIDRCGCGCSLPADLRIDGGVVREWPPRELLEQDGVQGVDTKLRLEDES